MLMFQTSRFSHPNATPSNAKINTPRRYSLDASLKMAEGAHAHIFCYKLEVKIVFTSNKVLQRSLHAFFAIATCDIHKTIDNVVNLAQKLSV